MSMSFSLSNNISVIFACQMTRNYLRSSCLIDCYPQIIDASIIDTQKINYITTEAGEMLITCRLIKESLKIVGSSDVTSRNRS